MFDLVHSDVRYDHQISDKYGQHRGSIIGDVQEETEEKIGTEQGFPHLTAKSGSDEDHMSK